MSVVVIAGSTAVGKSALAMGLAQEKPITIINADAMQLYRGMDIGTAKASAADRAAVPHACLDLLDVTESASVLDYRDHARVEIERAWQTGRTPVVVGGSLLYLRALCDVLHIPPTDPEVRARYNAELERVGSTELHRRLAEVAPAAAEHMEPRNGRRIVRALEVVELTGEFRSRLPTPEPWAPTLWLGLSADRDVLDDRIEQRVREMWEQGLVDEVRSLAEQGLNDGTTARKAVGYQQVLDHLSGEISEDEARSRTVAATKKLARRQARAFRGNDRIRWSDHQDKGVLAEWNKQIADFARAGVVSGED